MYSLQVLRRAALLVPLLLIPSLVAPAQASSPKPNNHPWLFAGFKGNSEAGVYFAISLDGYHWQLVNHGLPVVPPTQAGELMRDPFIQRAPDGTFRMVWTWSWYGHTIGYSQSSDLVTWAPHRELAVMADEPAAANVWAPALYYESAKHRWLIFWSSTIPGRFPGDNSGDVAKTSGGLLGLNHRIFSTTTTDFQAFTPARVFFDPGYSVIDATILPPTKPKQPYTLIFKDERKNPLEKHLLTASGSTMEGPWTNISQPISDTWCEGAAIVPVQATADSPAGYLAFYDHYRPPQHYGALFSPDLVHWSDATPNIGFPAGMRHGSFLAITQSEYDQLNSFSSGTQTATTHQVSRK